MKKFSWIHLSVCLLVFGVLCANPLSAMAGWKWKKVPVELAYYAYGKAEDTDPPTMFPTEMQSFEYACTGFAGWWAGQQGYYVGISRIEPVADYFKLYCTVDHPLLGQFEKGRQSYRYVAGRCPGEDRFLIGRGGECSIGYYEDEPEPPCPRCAPGDKPDYGNPINVLRREKTQVETDYQSTSRLTFVRYFSHIDRYSGNPNIPGSVKGWRHNFSKFIYTNLKEDLKNPSATYFRVDKYKGIYPLYAANKWPAKNNAQVILEDGRMLYFVSEDGGQTWSIGSEFDYKLSAIKNAQGQVAGWTLTTPNESVETYDQSGYLTSVRYRDGVELRLTYADIPVAGQSKPVHLLSVASDNQGRQIKLDYNAQGLLVRMTDPAGQVFQYEYDAKWGNLIKVTYPNQFKRHYHYAEPEHLSGESYKGTEFWMDSCLTGISEEEAGVVKRVGTYKYKIADGKPLPISTEGANGVNKYSIKFGLTKEYDQEVTLPGGVIQTITPFIYNDRLSGTYTDNIGGRIVTRSVYYDDNYNAIERSDYLGNITRYTYDLSRNLELTRLESVGKAGQRKTSTQWHASLRLPVQIDAPLLRTTYSYDDKGNLLRKTEQATSDATGEQGAGAAVVGKPRSWSYTYNSFGQILTATGPRQDKTSYSYDDKGNLLSITNALGQVTQLSQYDVHGRPGSIVDANGLTTTLRYNERGWLVERKQSGGGVNDTTQYRYDGAGQLLQTTLPDGNSITYRYDDAHRLVGISDQAGNSISYELDNSGNRIKETVNDTSGQLVRQTQQIFDARGRVTQVSGGN